MQKSATDSRYQRKDGKILRISPSCSRLWRSRLQEGKTTSIILSFKYYYIESHTIQTLKAPLLYNSCLLCWQQPPMYWYSSLSEMWSQNNCVHLEVVKRWKELLIRFECWYWQSCLLCMINYLRHEYWGKSEIERWIFLTFLWTL